MVMIQMTAVVAMAENRVIGDGKGLIWRIPDDLKRVKTLTMGCPLIMAVSYTHLTLPTILLV